MTQLLLQKFRPVLAALYSLWLINFVLRTWSPHLSVSNMGSVELKRRNGMLQNGTYVSQMMQFGHHSLKKHNMLPNPRINRISNRKI